MPVTVDGTTSRCDAEWELRRGKLAGLVRSGAVGCPLTRCTGPLTFSQFTGFFIIIFLTGAGNTEHKFKHPRGPLVWGPAQGAQSPCLQGPEDPAHASRGSGGPAFARAS